MLLFRIIYLAVLLIALVVLVAAFAQVFANIESTGKTLVGASWLWLTNIKPYASLLIALLGICVIIAVVSVFAYTRRA